MVNIQSSTARTLTSNISCSSARADNPARSSRKVSGQNYTLGYDAENRLATVSGALSASFVYNGDGRRVKSTVAGVTTAFIGDYYEWRGSAAASVKYYYAGGTRIAMRTGGGAPKYLLGDHLGSTSVLVNGDGSGGQAQGYMPWGETRYGGVGTEYQYTGQYRLAALGLDYYGARWYDPSLGRFVQADTVVPLAGQGAQAWDRYAFVNNNPLRYNDPSGHSIACGEGVDTGACGGETKESRYFEKRSYYENCRGGTGDCPRVQVLDDHKAIGVRMEISNWIGSGYDLNLDFMFFSDSNQFGLFAALGQQTGAVGGIGPTGGIIFGENMPDRSSYQGTTITTAGGDAPIPILGANLEIEEFESASYNPDGTVPNGTYIGGSPLRPEAGVYTGYGSSWDIIDTIISWISQF